MIGKEAQETAQLNNTTATGTPQESPNLRRAVGVWGSYTWGYADVEVDVYVALGLVMVAAQGAANVAFLSSGLVYVMVGLAYTELAAAYPMAGGGQFYFPTCLDLLAGYGYKPGRSLLAYLIVIFCFTCLYLFTPSAHLSWEEALVLSVVCFHGRGFLLQNMSLGDAFARLAAIEAVLGLLIEVSFIATFTQRFLGK
ncbi:hypothetical protein [Ktedonobacter robiniae]|uniref:Amino acid permease/ SLC12A domain-containing protein n=1 Tax=Ktedonobacter robiniae TaxID=2778365 RepID=A0ABQ3UH15_9CHLR|nr:hypothetical protein [Ktedonobacter robiniae]GHO52004.1 hypothetical protein KSB_04790 [Ktedonobacter robiniae]